MSDIGFYKKLDPFVLLPDYKCVGIYLSHSTDYATLTEVRNQEKRNKCIEDVGLISPARNIKLSSTFRLL